VTEGVEAGGHLSGDIQAMALLPSVLGIAGTRAVFLAGGIAAADDTRAALEGGASGVVAGTRFLLTRESRAHPEYQRRIFASDNTFRTTLFGCGWPAPHREVANAATRRWCHGDGTAKRAPRRSTGAAVCWPGCRTAPQAQPCGYRRLSPALVLVRRFHDSDAPPPWTARRCTRATPCCDSPL
jgi:NAD(P)H-dependent flavin oxidoreductase YrpB (nitropropane dioxygenase family)